MCNFEFLALRQSRLLWILSLTKKRKQVFVAGKEFMTSFIPKKIQRDLHFGA